MDLKNLKEYKGFKVIRFASKTDEQHELLTLNGRNSSLGTYIWKTHQTGHVEVLIPPCSIYLVMSELKSIEHEILIDNVQSFIDRDKNHSTNLSKRQIMRKQSTIDFASDPIFSDYHSTDDLMKFLLKQPITNEFSFVKTY
jgi:hypothetical protein